LPGKSGNGIAQKKRDQEDHRRTKELSAFHDPHRGMVTENGHQWYR